MLQLSILAPAIVNGLMTGAIYALVALGLTLIYGVLHIINFAHGSLLMVALYGVFFLYSLADIDPYLALPIMVAAMFALGYALKRTSAGPSRPGRARDEYVMLVTLGISIVLENAALYSLARRHAHDRDALRLLDHRPRRRHRPGRQGRRLAGAIVAAGLFGWCMSRTDLGRAIRAVAKERRGAHLVGIDVEHIYADELRHRHGLPRRRRLPAAAQHLCRARCRPRLRPDRLHRCRARRHGQLLGALIGGFAIGVTESICGLFLGESLGQIGIFVIFIVVLMSQPDRPLRIAGVRPP